MIFWYDQLYLPVTNKHHTTIIFTVSTYISKYIYSVEKVCQSTINSNTIKIFCWYLQTVTYLNLTIMWLNIFNIISKWFKCSVSHSIWMCIKDHSEILIILMVVEEFRIWAGHIWAHPSLLLGHLSIILNMLFFIKSWANIDIPWILAKSRPPSPFWVWPNSSTHPPPLISKWSLSLKV